MSLTAPGLALRCARCGECCRTVRVPLTERDLAELVTATGLAPEAIGEWLSPEEIDMTGEPETFVRLREGRRLLVLRHERDGCRFLVDDACTVHPHRPRACAAYPFALADPGDEDALVRLPGAPCLADLAGASEPLVECLHSLSAELADYARRVDAWNRRQRQLLHLRRLPKEAAAFFAHLLRPPASPAPSETPPSNTEPETRAALPAEAAGDCAG